METCVCIFILSISAVVLGLVGVAVFSLYLLVKQHHFARVEIEHAKIALKEEALKKLMQRTLTRAEYDFFCEKIKRFEL